MHAGGAGSSKPHPRRHHLRWQLVCVPVPLLAGHVDHLQLLRCAGGAGLCTTPCEEVWAGADLRPTNVERPVSCRWCGRLAHEPLWREISAASDQLPTGPLCGRQRGVGAPQNSGRSTQGAVRIGPEGPVGADPPLIRVLGADSPRPLRRLNRGIRSAHRTEGARAVLSAAGGGVRRARHLAWTLATGARCVGRRVAGGASPRGAGTTGTGGGVVGLPSSSSFSCRAAETRSFRVGRSRVITVAHRSSPSCVAVVW